jgi:hypothetical protein
MEDWKVPDPEGMMEAPAAEMKSVPKGIDGVVVVVSPFPQALIAA